jgi:hypothetical protein
MSTCKRRYCSAPAKPDSTYCHYDSLFSSLKTKIRRCKDPAKKAQLTAQRAELKLLGKKPYNKQQIDAVIAAQKAQDAKDEEEAASMNTPVAEVNALMDQKEAKDVISPETPEVHNPVKDLNLFQRNSPFKEYFTDCRMTPDGDFAVSDVIQKFKGCSTKTAMNVTNLVAPDFREQLKRYQFRRKNNALGPAIPVGSFNVIIEILSQLSGKNAQILRKEQADIATRAIAGDEALEEAVRDQRDVLPEAARNVLMQGLPSIQADVIRDSPTTKRPISPRAGQQVIKHQKTDLTGFGFQGVVIEGSINAQLMQSLIKLQLNQIELQKEKTKQLSIEGKVNETEILSKKEVDLATINKEIKLATINKEIKLATVEKDKAVELKKLKVPAPRKRNPLTQDIMRDTWEAKNNDEFIGKCEECKRSLCVMNVKFLTKEQKQNVAELLHLDNLKLACPACAKKSPLPVLNKTNRNKQRCKVWLQTMGKRYSEHCYCCRDHTIKILGSWHQGHVVSHAQGGTSTLLNLRPICPPCNSAMGTEDMKTFMKQNGFDSKPHPGDVLHAGVTTEKIYKDLLKNLVTENYSRGEPKKMRTIRSYAK